MLLNLDFKFKNFEGNEVEEATAAKLIAELLAGKTDGITAIKAMDWALKLYKDGEIEIDRADAQALEKIVNEAAQLTNAGKAPIILAIQSLKEVPKEA